MLGRSWFRKLRAVEAPMTVNIRGQTYTGRRVRLGEAIENGQGRIQLDDTWWTARSLDKATIAAGALVEIADADGATLMVKAVVE
jgi:membrane protein implicated in regulation of membrane protease activity